MSKKPEADSTLSTEIIDISKEDAESGDIESNLTNTGIQLRLAGSEMADVEADEDRELLEKEINVNTEKVETSLPHLIH